MNKILTFLLAICALSCSGNKITIYEFTAETNNPDIKWNFTKFLIDRKGRIVVRFEPVVTPEQIAPEIEALL